MTSNQIKYWELRERNRNNMQVERETQRANKEKERLQSQQIQTNFNLGLWNLDEQKRANLARETELNRHQLETEKSVRESNAIAQQNANTAKYQADIAASNLAELMQHNRVTEQIARDNYDETKRNNMVLEGIKNFEAVNKAANDQNARKVDWQKLDNETQRLYLKAADLDEKIRHNQATEAETKRYNDIMKNLKERELKIRQFEAQNRVNKDIMDLAKPIIAGALTGY